MNFNVDANLRQAIEQFPWDEQVPNTDLPISVDDANVVVNEVAEKIVAASNIRPTLESMAKKTMSLKEVCYLVVQSQESKLENPVVLNRIQQVTQDEKIILSHVFKELSGAFVQLEANALKAMTLLFGIQRVSEIAARNIPDLLQLTPVQELANVSQLTISETTAKNTPVPSRQLTQIEELEANLSQLIKLRNKFDINSVPVEQRGFLDNVDEQIKEKSAFLKALHLSLK